MRVPVQAVTLLGGVVIAGRVMASGSQAASAMVGVDIKVLCDRLKISALAIATCEVVSWVPTVKLLTKTASGNSNVGVAVPAAASPSAMVNFRLFATG